VNNVAPASDHGGIKKVEKIKGEMTKKEDKMESRTGRNKERPPYDIGKLRICGCSAKMISENTLKTTHAVHVK